MECLACDTLPEFVVGVDTDTTGCSMQLLLTDQDGKQVACKECVQADGRFTVQLTSADTTGLSGVYQLQFCMTDIGGLCYRKLAGTLTIVPKGGTP